MQFSIDFQLVFYSGSSLSIHTFRHLKHQDRTIFKPRGSKTLIFHYFQNYFNFARNNANFHNDAQTCTNRCFQILKAENVYYKDQQRAKRGFFMKKTRFFWETAVRLKCIALQQFNFKQISMKKIILGWSKSSPNVQNFMFFGGITHP